MFQMIDYTSYPTVKEREVHKNDQLYRSSYIMIKRDAAQYNLQNMLRRRIVETYSNRGPLSRKSSYLRVRGPRL